MGMGLSICRSIISEHGGELRFRNNENAGACFYFSLPLDHE
jgi:K+-sensing histidine kinase KdpD